MIELTTSYQLIKQEYVGNAYGDVYVKCYAKYDERDIANNRTKVTVATNLYTAGTWWSQSGNEWYTGATGLTTASGTAPSSYSPGEITLGTLTGWISHDNDGKKNIVVSSGFVAQPWGFAKTASDTVKLPDIPRASKINSITNSISSNGDTVKVNVNFTKYASSFYQQLVLMNVGRTETIATFNGVSSGTDYYLDATARQKLYNWIGTSLDNKGVICDLKTYTSSAMTTLVGTYSDVTYFKLPTYSLSFTTSSVEDSITTYDTYKPNSNTFIANLSKPKYTFSASSSTGSTYGRGIGYSIGSTTITSPYTNNNYTGQSLTITASDGRRSVNSTPSMTHVLYFNPTLTTKIVRPTPTGSTATVTVNGTLYKGTNLTNLETPSLTFKYTESGGSEQEITIPLTLTDSGDVTSFTGSATLTGLNYKRTISWNSTLSDRLNITTNNNGVLPEGLPIWNAYKRNDENYFNVNGNLIADTYGGYELDLNTNNTTDTWVPVLTNGKIQHRVISAKTGLEAYPVGSIYMSWNATSPASLFGGTWTQMKNAFMHATNNTTGNGSTGNGTGTATNSYTLTTNQIPSHSHNGLRWASTSGSRISFNTGSGIQLTYTSGGSTKEEICTVATGGGQGHSHNIPYISVFVWRRTA